MVGTTIEEGWLYKQSGLFKLLSKTKLVLDTESLLTFDKSGRCSDKLPVHRIDKVERQNSHKDLFGLKISSQDKEFQFFSEDVSTINRWLVSLESVKSPSPGSQECVISQFASFKQALQQREQELLDQNETMYRSKASKVESEIDSLSEIEAKIEQSAREHRGSQKGYRRMNCMLPEVPEVQDTPCPKFNINALWMHKFMDKYINVEFVNPNIMNAHRSNVTRALKWKYNGEKADALSFVVSKDILLTGIGICRPYKASGSLKVKKLLIIAGKVTNGKLVYVHKEKTNVEFADGLSVKEIQFSSPVLLKNNQTYSAIFVIQGDSSYKCVDCFERCVVGDVVWEFSSCEFVGSFQSNRSDVACGPIANFQFEIINNSRP